MKTILISTGLAALLFASSAMAATTTTTTTPVKPAATAIAATSCDDLSKQVDVALKGNTLSPTDLKKATEHDKAGRDLCKAKKNTPAITEFETVLKMLKKA